MKIKGLIPAFFAAAVLALCPLGVCTAEGQQNAVSESAPELYENDTFTDQVLTYNKAKGGVYVTKCTSGATSVTVAEKIDGYTILGIYDGAFSECTELRSVEIAEGIGYIGEGAFFGCENLEKIKLPEGITEIPKQCFTGCIKLKNAEIPETVESIGAYAFSYCESLSLDCIPGTVKKIGDYAFSYANTGSDIKIPEGVETLGAMTFYYCEDIRSVSVPSTLKSAGSLAFMGCGNLEEFEVSDKSLYFTAIDGVLYSKDETILHVYPMGKRIAEYAVPEKTAYIEPGAFFGNGYLEKVTMTDSIKNIGDMAFSSCSALKTINIPNRLEAIGGSLFSDCISLQNIEIPASVNAIGDYAFLQCDSLKTITVPDTVKTIGDHALGFGADGSGNFSKISGFTIKANFETAAKDYAKANGVSIEYLDRSNFPFVPVILGSVGGLAVIVLVVVIVKRKGNTSGSEDDEAAEDDDETEDDE